MLLRARLLARARAPISVRLATPTPGVRIRLPGPLSAPTSRLASTSPSVRASVAAQLGTHVSFSPLPPSTTPTPSALSSSPDSSSSSSSSSTATTTIAEADSAPRKLPRKLATYTPALARLSARTGVPLPSLLASFLVLHELTALVPLVVLFYLFSALGAGSAFLHWLHSIAKTATGEEVEEGPFASAAHVVRGWYDEGARRVERVGRRYGLFGFEKGSKADGDGTVGREAAGAVADAVAAYVVVKALMPLRVAVSVGAAPGFARLVFRPLQRLVSRLRTPRASPAVAGRIKPASASASESASGAAKSPRSPL